MFSLLMAKTKIIAVTVVSELCGKERRHGCSIKFEMKSNNFVLIEFNPQLRHALYEYDDAPKQPALEGVEDEMLGLTRLKFPKLGMPLKYEWEGAGYELQLHIGASGRDDIVLEDVGLSDFQFQCNEGGSVITTFKAMTRPTAQQQGRIDHMLQLETELSLKPPSAKQRELAA